MKKLILMLLAMITFSICNAQNAMVTKDGNYVSVSSTKGQSYSNTGKTFTDMNKKIIYPIYIATEGKSNGKLFIFKVSKKTGKQSRSYLKLIK